jgi:hypothetical protein
MRPKGSLARGGKSANSAFSKKALLGTFLKSTVDDIKNGDSVNSNTAHCVGLFLSLVLNLGGQYGGQTTLRTKKGLSHIDLTP